MNNKPSPYFRFASKRFPFRGTFSYQDFMETGKQLLDILRPHLAPLDVQVLAYSSMEDYKTYGGPAYWDTQEGQKALSKMVLATLAHRTGAITNDWDKRKRFDFSQQSFTEKDYLNLVNPDVIITQVEGSLSQMASLSVDPKRKEFEFFGQDLTPPMYEPIWERFHHGKFLEYYIQDRPQNFE